MPCFGRVSESRNVDPISKGPMAAAALPPCLQVSDDVTVKAMTSHVTPLTTPSSDALPTRLQASDDVTDDVTDTTPPSNALPTRATP